MYKWLTFICISLLLVGCGNDKTTVTKPAEEDIENTAETTEEASEVGRRSNPVPVGETIKIKDWIYGNGEEDYNATVNVTFQEVARGESVYQEALKQNEFNDAPMEGYEYIALDVLVELVEAETDDFALYVSDSDFQFMSKDGSPYDYASLVYEPELSGDIYAGGSVTGYVIGQVKIDDEVLVVYEDAEWNNVFFATK